MRSLERILAMGPQVVADAPFAAALPLRSPRWWRRWKRCGLSSLRSGFTLFQLFVQGRQLVLHLPDFVLREGLLLLPILELLLQILDLLLLLLFLVAGAGGFLCRLLNGLTLLLQKAGLHDPLLRRDRTAELLVVGDDDHAALELLDGLGQSTQTVTVQVVRRLIKDHDVRVLPHARAENDLDLLTARQALDGRVARRLLVEAEVHQVLLHALARQHLALEPGSHRLLLVLTLDQRQVTHGDHDITGNPDRIFHGLELELHLVLLHLLLLVLTPGEDRFNNDGFGLLFRLLAHLECVGRGIDEELLLNCHFLGVGFRFELNILLVVVPREPLEDVLRRGLRQMLLKMLECMLRDVSKTQVRVTVDFALSSLELSDQDLDSSGLPSTVRTDDSDAGNTRCLEVNVEDGRRSPGRVLECHFRQLHKRLGLRLHPLQRAGDRERELHHVVLELEVALLLGVSLDELLEHHALVPAELTELAILEIDDRVAHLVEEAGVVRSGDHRSVLAHERPQPVLQPLDVRNIQMPGRLVKHKKVRFHEQRRTQLHLHFPAAGVGGHDHASVGRTVAADTPRLIAEPDLLERGCALLGSHLRDFLVHVVHRVFDPLDTGQVDVQDREALSVLPDLPLLNLVLHEDSAQLVSLRKPVDLLVSDRTHERRLTAVVRPEQAVELVLLQVQARGVEQRKGPVRETELGPGQIRTGAVLPLLDLRLRRHLALRQNRGNSGCELRIVHRAGKGSRPLRLLPAQGERQANADAGAVVQAAVPIRDAVRRQIPVDGRFRHLDFLNFLDDPGQFIVRTLAHSTCFRITDALLLLLKERLHLGDERAHFARLLHELAHVLNDDATLALDVHAVKVQPTDHDRDEDSESWRLHLLHEDATSQGLNALSHRVGLLNALRHGRDEDLQVLVPGAMADGLESIKGSSLHFLLDIPHEFRDRREQLDQASSNLNLAALSRGCDARHARLLLGRLPLHPANEHGNNLPDRPDGHLVADSRESLLGRGHNRLLLVVESFDQLWQILHDEGQERGFRRELLESEAGPRSELLVRQSLDDRREVYAGHARGRGFLRRSGCEFCGRRGVHGACEESSRHRRAIEGAR